MSRDHETYLQRAIRQRKLRKMRQRIFAIALVPVVAGIVYCLHQGLMLAFAIFSLAGLMLAAPLLSTGYRNLSRRYNLSGKHIFGLTLLVLALIVQANPSLTNWAIARWFYNPQPHEISSPWPWKEHATIHPVIASMPSKAEKSISSVAAYIAAEEDDPWMRIKAIHDYVVTRVDYDIDVLKNAGLPWARPKQDARTVFRTHKAVCEGYARLFNALGKAIGLDVVYVSGNVRREFAPTDIIPQYLRFTTSRYDWTRHAWNAVKVEGRWYLVDTTWDDTDRDDPSYRSDYLLLPPQAMIVSHLPRLKSWQLLKSPLDRDEFEEMPMLHPQFFSEDLKLRSPKQYRTKVRETAAIRVTAPPNYEAPIEVIFTELKEDKFSFLDLVGSSEEDQQDIQWGWCSAEGEDTGEDVRLACKFPSSGTYQAFMLVAGKFVGEFKFQAKI